MFGRQIPIHVIDFEGAPSYGVVEYGVATLLDGAISTTSTRLCRAFAPIDPHDVAVHGISYEESLAHAPFADDYDFFVDLRRRGPLGAHNARYEARLVKQTWAFPPFVPAWGDLSLNQNPITQDIQSGSRSEVKEEGEGGDSNIPALCVEAGRARANECATWAPWIDSCALARKLAPGLPRYKLQVVVECLGLQNELDALALDKCPPSRRRYHAALYDAIASALILKKLLCQGACDVPHERLFSVKAD